MLVHINKFYSVSQAGQEALKRQLAIDEANCPTYHRYTGPITLPKAQNAPVGAFCMAKEIVRGLLP